MSCLKIPPYYYFVFLILNLLFTSPILGLRMSGYGSSSEGHSIFRDDYGITIKDSDCPTKVDDVPKFIYNNASYYVSYFTLFCLAKYPITIDFEGNQPYLPSIKMIVANASPGNMSKVCYILQLSSHLYRDGSSPVGNYTCRSVQNPNKSSSQYIFVNSNWGFRFTMNSFNVRKAQTVYVNQNNVSRFLIPCPANKPTLLNPILKKEENGTGDETPIQSFVGFKTSYNPINGFTVDYSKSLVDNTKIAMPTTPAPTPISTTSPVNISTTSSVPNHPTASTPIQPSPKVTPITGKYVCSDPGALTTSDVTVKHADFLVFPNQTNVTFDGGRLTFECYSNKKVNLSVIQNATKLDSVIEVARTSEFAPLGFLYGAKVTFSTQDPKAIGKIACVETETKKLLFKWSFDNGYICKCEWNNTYDEQKSHYYYYPNSPQDQEFGESPDSHENNRYPGSGDWDYYEPPYYASDLTCYNSKSTSVNFIFHHCSNPMECDFIRQSCAKDAQNCPTIGTDYFYRPLVTEASNRTTNRALFSPGFIQCTADGYTSNFNVTTDWKGDMYFNDQKPKKDEETLHIRAAESHVYTGDSMLYACMAAGPGIVHPIVWGFKFDDDQSFNYSNYDFDGYQYNDRVQIGYSRSVATMRTTYLEIPSTRRASNLYCFAPKWDSSGSWAKIGVKLQIEDAQVADNPPKCPVESNPIIVMYRNSSLISRNRIRLPHLVTGKDALVFDPVQFVSLYCMAKFPVIWLKDGLNITSSRTSRANCKQSDGKILLRQLYKSTVSFKINSFNATGNYTCRSISPHRSRSTSTYIYAMSPENRTTFVDEGKHHIIRHQWQNTSRDWSDGKWVVLPCRINSPNIIPYLFLDIPEQERIEKIPYKQGLQYLRFDPKVGFSLDVTYNRVVRWNRTIFFCSDHEDGSFIGTMITLELIYDQPRQNVTLTTMPPTKTSTSSTLSPVSSTPTTRQPDQIAQTATDKRSNTGFIVTTILLLLVCLGFIGIIYNLYKKVRVQRAKPASHELDWTRAMSHTVSTTNNGNAVIGNGNYDHVSTSTHMNAEFVDTPNILESLDNNGLIEHEQIPTIDVSLIDVGDGRENSNDNREQDRSISNLSDAWMPGFWI